MKKKKQSHIENLRPVILYLDDIEQIVEIFKTISDKVEISTEEYKYENISELQNLSDERLSDLNIEIKEPYVSLGFKKCNVSLYRADDDAVTVGLCEKLKEFLFRHTRKFSRIMYIVPIWSFFIGVGSSTLVIGTHRSDVNRIFIGCIVLACGIVLTLISWYLRFNRFSTIYLQRKKEFPSFWKRNKDELVVNILVGCICLLVGYSLPSITNLLSFRKGREAQITSKEKTGQYSTSDVNKGQLVGSVQEPNDR
jgi:hypothetical protein